MSEIGNTCSMFKGFRPPILFFFPTEVNIYKTEDIFPPPGTDLAGKCPAVALGSGGWGGGRWCWAKLELTDALTLIICNVG